MTKKFFNKNLNIVKFFDQRNIGSIPRIFLSSLIVIFFFYSMPQIINFANKNNNEFKNKSKAVLAYTLNSEKNIILDNNVSLDENDLLVDIFSCLLYTSPSPRD